ncbi:MAG: alpha/beta hydrolase-fold protein [Armatimonas sp.]
MPQNRADVVWNIPDRPEIPGVEHGVLHSVSMDRDIGFNVYMPAGYAQDKRRYPVVYFLHGAGGTENSDAGGFSGLIQQEIDAKRIPPVLCVFPNGGMSGYADRPERKIMGESLIIKELIPLIDSRYRTIPKREGRAICGFSMGGGGAMRLSLQHPDMFCAAASWAAALGTFGGAKDPSAMLKENEKRIRGKVRLLLIVGDKDLTYASHQPFLQTLDSLRLPYNYHKLVGVDHNLGVYYQQTGQELVKFVTAPLARAK